jgi:hypothetical protein
LYYAIQQPWIKREAFKATRAYPVHKAKGEITYKPIEKTSKEFVSLISLASLIQGPVS